MKQIHSIIAILICQSLSMNAQTNAHTISFAPGFVQIKDAYNYGLVHKGVQLSAAYTFRFSSATRLLENNAQAGLGLLSEKGIGLGLTLKPIDFYYGFKLSEKGSVKLALGPYLAGIYKWQLYPELQSAQMFWISSWEIGPRLRLSIPLKGRTLNFSLANAVLSLNSRPDLAKEEYYYSLSLSDILSNPHSNMKPGFQDLHNHIMLGLSWVLPERRFTIGYELEYESYTDYPDFKYMLHTINMNWKIGKK